MRIPVSFGLIALSLALYLWQHVLFIGIFLMMLAAPLWSIFLINAGILGVGIETFVRRLHPAWLLVPGIWFGGNGALAAYDHLRIMHIRSEIAEHNASVHIPFDPRRHALVSVGNSSPRLNVSDYDIPVVYTEYRNGGIATYRAERLATHGVCQRVRHDPTYQNAGIQISGFHERSDEIRGGDLVTDFCKLDAEETPPLPIVRVATKTVKTRQSNMPVALTTTTISTPDGTRSEIEGGMAFPHPWIPRPILGCVLNDASSSWDCFSVFARANPVPLIANAGRFGSESVALARALSVQPFAQGGRFARADEEVMNRLKLLRQQKVDAEAKALDLALADPTVEIGGVPFSSLRGRQEILIPRIAQMVSAIEQGVAHRQNARNNAQQIFGLLLTAPAKKLAPYRRRLEALYEKDRWFRYVGSDPPPPTIGKEIVITGRQHKMPVRPFSSYF